MVVPKVVVSKVDAFLETTAPTAAGPVLFCLTGVVGPMVRQ